MEFFKNLIGWSNKYKNYSIDYLEDEIKILEKINEQLNNNYKKIEVRILERQDLISLESIDPSDKNKITKVKIIISQNTRIQEIFKDIKKNSTIITEIKAEIDKRNVELPKNYKYLKYKTKYLELLSNKSKQLL